MLIALSLAVIALAAIDIVSWWIFSCMGQQIGESGAGDHDQKQPKQVQCTYNGGVVIAGFQLTARWGPEAWTAFATLIGELGLHFVGRIAYIDSPGSGVSRQMAFRRKYNVHDQRFHRIWETENEHEYAD